MPRVLLRLAFDGTLFWGSQRQPDRPTVDGTVLDALASAGLLTGDPDLRPQGRTDRGVSARDYPIALDAERDLETIARTIAGSTQGIVPWAGCEVAPGWDPRRQATARTYRYHVLPDQTVDLDALRQTWSAFQGTHTFRHFSRHDPEREPERTILATHVHETPEAWVLEVQGESFLWNQVRRMVAAAWDVACGRLTLKEVEQGLKGTPLPSPRTMPAEGLVLHQVQLPVETVLLPGACALGRDRLADELARVRQRVQVLEHVLDVPTTGGPSTTS